MKTKKQIITKVFRRLKDQQVNFVVLRNFENISKNCTIENDIDILIHDDSMPLANEIFRQYHFERSLDTDIYFYTTKPHQHFYLYAKDIHFDVVSGLYYRSINDPRQWVPIHQTLQEQIFTNKIFDENARWFYMPSNLDQFLHLICHCIFDKRRVTDDYKVKIQTIFSKLDMCEAYKCIELIFFKFSKELINIIKKKETESLYERYITFTGY